jgi:NADH-quinone oxidoreductase subunit M
MLAYTIYISFAGALLLALMPRVAAGFARVFALLVAVAGLAVGLAAFVQAGASGPVAVANLAWIPSMGIHYTLAADGISRVLVLLTGLAAVAGILFSWTVSERTSEFFAFFLALIGGVYGVFLSVDLFLLFVFYEIAIVPKYFLIAIWGSTRREYAAMKLALYSFIGSAMVLVGLLAAYVTSGAHSMDLHVLAAYPYPVSFQMWAFPLVFTGFAILAGMWPFHTCCWPVW